MKLKADTLTVRLLKTADGDWYAYCVEEREMFKDSHVWGKNKDPGVATQNVLFDARLRDRFEIPYLDFDE